MPCLFHGLCGSTPGLPSQPPLAGPVREPIAYVIDPTTCRAMGKAEGELVRQKAADEAMELEQKEAAWRARMVVMYEGTTAANATLQAFRAAEKERERLADTAIKGEEAPERREQRACPKPGRPHTRDPASTGAQSIASGRLLQTRSGRLPWQQRRRPRKSAAAPRCVRCGMRAWRRARSGGNQPLPPLLPVPNAAQIDDQRSPLCPPPLPAGGAHGAQLPVLARARGPGSRGRRATRRRESSRSSRGGAPQVRAWHRPRPLRIA